MNLNIFLLNIYRATSTKQGFVNAVKLNSCYSNCEDDVIESIWNLIEIIPTDSLFQMFHEYLPKEKYE